MSADSLTLKGQESKDGKLMNCLFKVSANNLNIKTLAVFKNTEKVWVQKTKHFIWNQINSALYISKSYLCL